MEKIKPVVTEKDKFGYRDKSTHSGTFYIIWTKKILIKRSKQTFFFEWFGTNWGLSIETLMKKINLSVREKDEFEYGDKSFLLVLFGKFGNSDFWTLI